MTITDPHEELIRRLGSWSLTVYLAIASAGTGGLAWLAVIVSHGNVVRSYWFYASSMLWTMLLIISGVFSMTVTWMSRQERAVSTPKDAIVLPDAERHLQERVGTLETQLTHAEQREITLINGRTKTPAGH